MRKGIKPLVLILVAIFVVSGAIAGILTVVQVLPDVRQYAQTGGVNMEPYAEAWSCAFTPSVDMSIDVFGIDVEVNTHSGKTIEASFEGTRSPDANGNLPSLELVERSGDIVLQEAWPERMVILNLSAWNSGQIRGTLTVLMPQEAIGAFTVSTFSGNTAVSSLAVDSLKLDGSSGNIIVEDIVCEGDLDVTTFSGAQELRGVTAGEVNLDASSGRITAQTLAAQSLTIEEFSGDVSVADAQVEAGASISTSSGNIDLARFSANTLNTDQFSGKLRLEDVQVAYKGNLTTSSGDVIGQTAAFGNLEFNGFSGKVEIEALSAESIRGETSSGDVRLGVLTNADASISTFSGRVELTLPRDASFAYDIETFSGVIDIGYGKQNASGDRDANRSGTVGGGERNIEIDTSSGDVTILGAGD
jgi:DUF4097 and DUF4098 domain-containing protein YvlB